MAELGECCSHVGALLFYLEYAYLKKKESSKSVQMFQHTGLVHQTKTIVKTNIEKNQC